jgi:hypothetical protein
MRNAHGQTLEDVLEGPDQVREAEVQEPKSGSAKFQLTEPVANSKLTLPSADHTAHGDETLESAN